jgi:hypothetical protein
MGSVRPHSDLKWSLIAWSTLNGAGGGLEHESDFVKDFQFVRGTR